MIGGGVSLYIYPDNLKSKATLWLWELRDIGIVGIGCLISVFALAQLGFILPIVFTAAYAFLSIRIEDTSFSSCGSRPMTGGCASKRGE